MANYTVAIDEDSTGISLPSTVNVVEITSISGGYETDFADGEVSIVNPTGSAVWKVPITKSGAFHFNFSSPIKITTSGLVWSVNITGGAGIFGQLNVVTTN